MTTEEYIKLLLGEKDVAIAQLRAQIDEKDARLAELENDKGKISEQRNKPVPLTQPR